MSVTCSIANKKKRLPTLVKRAMREGAAAIKQDDKVVAYMISRERMEAIAETMNILGNPDAMRHIQDYEKGKVKFHSANILDDN